MSRFPEERQPVAVRVESAAILAGLILCLAALIALCFVIVVRH